MELQHNKISVPLSPTLPSFDPIPILFVIELAEVINFENIPFPFITTKPKTYNFRLFDVDPESSRYSGWTQMRKLKRLMGVVGIGQGSLRGVECPTGYTRAPPPWCAQFGNYHNYWSEWPTKYFEQVIFLTLANDPDIEYFMFHLEPKLPGSFLRTFYGFQRPLIYVMYYESVNQVQVVQSGALVCMFCENVDSPYFSDLNFNCSGSVPEESNSCAAEMNDAAIQITHAGKSIYWSTDWHHPDLDLNYLLLTPKTFLEQPKFYQQLAMTLFAFDSNSSSPKIHAYDHFANLRFHIPPRDRDFYTLRMSQHFTNSDISSFILVSTVGVTSEMDAVNLYLKAFDDMSWLLFGLSIALFSAVLVCFGFRLWTSSPLQFCRNLWFCMATILDQGVEMQAIRGQRQLRLLSSAWLLAILILTNHYRSVLQSRFSSLFPYSANIKRLEDLTDFSIYVFKDDGNCTSFKDIRQIGFSVEWNQWDLSGRLSPWPPDAQHSPYRLSSFRFMEDEQAQEDFPGWTKRQIKYLRTWYNCQTETEYRTEDNQCNVPIVDEFEAFLHHTDYVCPENFNNYFGAKYEKKVELGNRILRLPLEEWNITIDYVDMLEQDYDLEYSSITTNIIVSNKEDIKKLYWMSRKPKAVFVFTKKSFPWYWNLFKKEMQKDSSLRFAHTGPKSSKTISLKQRIFERNEAPFWPYIPYSYPKPAKWMATRLKAVTESGLLDFFYKWDQILRPPRRERLNEEVDESTDGSHGRALAMEDPAIRVIVSVAGIGYVIACAVAVFEVLANHVQNAVAKIL